MPQPTDSVSTLLLKELGEDLELPLIFDEQEQCLLVLDDSLMISIHQQSPQGWVMYGMLGEFWQPDRDFFIYLSELNRSLIEQGQGTLIFIKENDALLYLQYFPLDGATRTTLSTQLGNFNDWLQKLMETLDQSAAGQARKQGPIFSPGP